MKLSEKVADLESEMFNTLTIGYMCLQYKESKKLKMCLTALDELEIEYFKITKHTFLNKDSILRLQKGYAAMNGEKRVATK